VIEFWSVRARSHVSSARYARGDLDTRHSHYALTRGSVYRCTNTRVSENNVNGPLRLELWCIRTLAGVGWDVLCWLCNVWTPPLKCIELPAQPIPSQRVCECTIKVLSDRILNGYLLSHLPLLVSLLYLGIHEPRNLVSSVMLYTENNWFCVLYLPHSSTNFNNFWQKIATELELS